jgi:hypothetical protein
MMRQELIFQKVRPRLFSKGQTQSWIRTRSAGDYNNSDENTYIAAPTAVSYSPVASKIRLAAPAIPLAFTMHFDAAGSPIHHKFILLSKSDLSSAQKTLKSAADIGKQN